MSCQSRDSISTVLCHSVRFESPNEQGGATVEIKSRDCQDMKGSTVFSIQEQCKTIKSNDQTKHLKKKKLEKIEIEKMNSFKLIKLIFPSIWTLLV